jgi:hypothetical protein
VAAPSLLREWVCNLLVQLLLGLTRAITLGSKSHRTQDHILLSHLRLPNLEGQISPRNRVAQLYPRALGSLFVASYDSQDYGGDILTRLHVGLKTLLKLKLIYDQQSVGQSVLVSGAHLGPLTNFSFSLKFPSDICVFVILQRPLCNLL